MQILYFYEEDGLSAESELGKETIEKMTQQDVMNLLKKFPEEGLTSKEIHRMLHEQEIKIGIGTITVNLRRLRKNNGFVIMYYPHKNKKYPKYILRKYATKKILAGNVKL